MTWRRALADWKELDQRRPPAFWLGLSGTIAGALAMAALEVQRLAPRGAARWTILSALLVVLVVVGRRVFWNDAERRLRLPWRIAAYVLLIGLLNLATLTLGLHMSGTELQRGSGPALRVTSAALVVFTLAAIIAVRLFDRRPVRELGIVPGPGFWGDLAFGLALGAVLMSAIFAVEWSAGWIRIAATAHTRSPAEPFALAFLRMAGAFACVGFYEELTSRGYLLRTMAQGFTGRRVPARYALAIAVVVSSLLFGLGHADNPNAGLVSTLNIVFAGIVLALPYVLTGRLAASIGFHVTWNFCQSTVYGFPTSGFVSPASALLVEQGGPPAWTGGPFGPEGGLLGLLALLMGAAAILWRERLRSGRVALYTALVEGEAVNTALRTAMPATPSASRDEPASSGGG